MVALFSHGQFGAALAARWIGLAVGEARHLAFSPASLSILDYESGHPTVPVIALWNAYSDSSLSAGSSTLRDDAMRLRSRLQTKKSTSPNRSCVTNGPEALRAPRPAP
jgi:broad specificity phosphatase PhoE